MKEAKAAVLKLLRTFTERSSIIDHKVYSALNVVENTIDDSDQLRVRYQIISRKVLHVFIIFF
jgi:hypothetical protein